jgi:negative regulator of sigma E activity
MTSRLVARRRRAVPLAVVALAALAAALLTVTTSSESAHASPANHEHGTSQFVPLATAARVSFHDQCGSSGKTTSRGRAWLL